MASLDDKIAALRAEIEVYELKLENATSCEEKSELGELIISCRDNLTELLGEENALATVGRAKVLSAGRHLHLRKCLSLFSSPFQRTLRLQWTEHLSNTNKQKRARRV